MLKVFKIIVKNYETKTGVKFTKMSAKGKYIPIATTEDETNYIVKFVGDVNAPTKDGIYQVSFENNNCWVDTRTEKAIVRVRPHKVIYDKALPQKSFEETESK